MPSDPQPRLLTYRDVAEQLQVSDWSVRKLVKDGLLPVTRLGHRTARVDPADLDAYIKAQKVQTEATGGAA